MSDLLCHRPKQTVSMEVPTGPTISDWLFTMYPKAQQAAEQIIKRRRSWENEYCLSGRFSNASRNVPRAIRIIQDIFIEENPFFKKSHTDMNQCVELLLPISCYAILVGEIISAAGAEYYYKYEKSYD